MSILVLSKKENVNISVVWFFNSKGTPWFQFLTFLKGLIPVQFFILKMGLGFDSDFLMRGAILVLPVLNLFSSQIGSDFWLNNFLFKVTFGFDSNIQNIKINNEFLNKNCYYYF